MIRGFIENNAVSHTSRLLSTLIKQILQKTALAVCCHSAKYASSKCAERLPDIGKDIVRVLDAH